MCNRELRTGKYLTALQDIFHNIAIHDKFSALKELFKY